VAEGTRSIAKQDKEDQSCIDDVLCLEFVEGKKQKYISTDDEDSGRGHARDQA
jgi:hypothetical protein